MTSSSAPSLTEYVHGGVESDPICGAVLTPIVQSTTFKQPSVEGYMSMGYSYSRCGNPTVAALDAKIARLENAKCPAVTFGTGMAATNCLMTAFLKSGDHVVITKCSYGGTNRAARVLYQRQFGIDFSFVDMSDLKAVEDAIRPGKTKMIFSETPCNPTLQLADVRGISDLAKKHSLKNPAPLKEDLQEGDGPSWECVNGRILHVCDSTLATPFIMKALDFGADIALISLTKYYDGHNMALGGALVTNDKDVCEHLRFKQNVMGSILTPQVAFSIMQTVKTMGLRVKQQCDSAMKIAKYLEKHPKVQSVTYPGLPSHPQYEIACRQHYNGNHGGMVAFEVKGGSDAGRRVMNACKLPWTLAENLGSTESIMTCPSVFTHANMPKQMRLDVNITDGLIRLSVGIEDADDLIHCLEKALATA